MISQVLGIVTGWAVVILLHFTKTLNFNLKLQGKDVGLSKMRFQFQ